MIINRIRKIPEETLWEKLGWTWVHTFFILQFIFQIFLLFPQVGVLRVLMRTVAFSLSLLFLIIFPARGQSYPAAAPGIIVMFILFINLILHPLTNSLGSGLAQCLLYLAIIAPIFWMTGLKVKPKGFETLIFIIWAFHFLSAGLGVLQMYFPGQFQPALSTAIQSQMWGGENLLITLANGQQVYRPMGLTDVPGGAASSGQYSILFGVIMTLKYRNPFLWIMGIVSISIGLFCILLSQVRSILVSTIICLLFFALILVRTANFSRLSIMAVGIISLFITTFSWAIAVGGTQTQDRLNTLFTDSFQNIYQQNRGHFLQDTINNLLPQYPLGAGLGRWGMMNNCFGDPTNMEAKPIWVEIQWTAWVLDGGLPLVIVYMAMITIACYTTYQIATNRRLGDFTLFGALILGYNVGAIATTFNYPFFISQGGLELWLLNTALFIAANHYQRQSLNPGDNNNG